MSTPLASTSSSLSSSSTACFPPIEPNASLILAWQIANRKVLLIGGGQVAAGRLYALLNANAIVTLISPSDHLSDEVRYRLDDRSLSDKLSYIDRVFEEGDIEMDDWGMVLTAIDEAGLSSRICTMCRAKKIPVNVADVPPECDFYFGSIVRRGSLQIMISTNGKGPRLANRIRRSIENDLPEDIGSSIENVGKLRAELRKKVDGKDVDTIKRRMDWMIQVCDKWSLKQLAVMDEGMRKQVLDGWEKGQALGFYQINNHGNGSWIGKVMGFVGVTKCPMRDNPDGKNYKCPFVMGTSGFLLGLGTAVAAFSLINRSRN